MAVMPLRSTNLRQASQEEPGQGLDGADVIVHVDEDGDDQPELDEKGNIVSIAHPDGGITINIDGSPLANNEQNNPEGWFDNLIDRINQAELEKISSDLLQAIADDIESRKEWIEDRATGLKLLGLKLEMPGIQGASDGAPVEGMSKVRHPLLLEAVLRFQANARSELLPTDGPVKIRNDNNGATLEEDRMADALESDLNHYFTAVAREYYPDTDRMLLLLGFGGTSFKKIYFCPLRNRPVSETVDATDLIVNNAATDLANAQRITHRVMMKPSTVKRLQILGVYKDIELATPGFQNLDSVQREKNNQQGIQQGTLRPDDRDREIYECYCELDIVGYEHSYKGKKSGLEIPYRVTIDVSSRQILSIVRNYDEETNELPEARVNFVKYTFVPGLGFYDIGLLHILGNTTNAVTAAWRELLDAGMYNNFPGFLMADTGARQNTNIFRVPPGGGALVKTGGMPITQAVMPLPYKEPSGALMTLVQNMVETGQRVGGTSEQQVGEGKPDAPVGTTLALIEQATKILNSVHKRLHAAQAEEIQLVVREFREHPESFWQRNRKPAYKWDEQTFVKALDDCNIVPQSDPNTASHSQRVMKVQALLQLSQAAPTLYDPVAINMAALQALGFPNPQQFMVPPSALGRPSPDQQKDMAAAQINKQNADARMLDSQSRAKEIDAKIQLDQQRLQLDAQQGDGGGLGPAQVMDMQIKQQDIAQRQQDSVLDAINRKRDRESRERLAAIRLAEDIAKNPESLGLINQIIPPEMLKRLEGNEAPLNDDSGEV